MFVAKLKASSDSLGNMWNPLVVSNASFLSYVLVSRQRNIIICEIGALAQTFPSASSFMLFDKKVILCVSIRCQTVFECLLSVTERSKLCEVYQRVGRSVSYVCTFSCLEPGFGS